ncbi:helix-turn-helix domain-containing protein [Clostridium sp. Marseille-P2415]|uniref:helix-turn-helix domain-containing protein n=1 Tax=Clostridium sp. Marseille-P2415 TaxID=1805471 RepID=UPI0009888860|nr:helix-turn-helix transcriptional regulator [Clostridium sp. Marseille-P2415]
MEQDYINKRITELRIKKGVAEHKMSIELGHSRSYVQSISSGRSLPSMAEFLAICEYLDVTPKDFFDNDNPNPPLIRDAMDKLKTLPESDLLLILTMINRLQS